MAAKPRINLRFDEHILARVDAAAQRASMPKTAYMELACAWLLMQAGDRDPVLFEAVKTLTQSNGHSPLPSQP